MVTVHVAAKISDVKSSTICGSHVAARVETSRDGRVFIPQQHPAATMLPQRPKTDDKTRDEAGNPGRADR